MAFFHTIIIIITHSLISTHQVFDSTIKMIQKSEHPIGLRFYLDHRVGGRLRQKEQHLKAVSTALIS